MRRKALLINCITRRLAGCLVLITLLFTGLTQGERMVMTALEHLGQPYVFNTAGPDRFDCSGLVLFAAAREGLPPLPHAAKELYNLGRPVAMHALLPGDMLCFDTVRDSDPSDHVGFYMGGNMFVHASSSKHQVTVSALEGFYLEKCTGARRLGCAYI